MILLALLLPLLAAPPAGAPLDLAGYVERLREVDGLLERHDTGAAALRARDLLGQTIEAGSEQLRPDAWVLEPIARGAPHRARLRAHLDQLSRALPEARDEGPPGKPLLEELRREQAVSLPQKGGELTELPIEQPPLLETLIKNLAAGFRWAGKALGDLLDWLAHLFPSEAVEKLGGTARVVPLVLVGVGLILVLVIALALRSQRFVVAKGAASAARAAPVEDEDPLSRTASGWEARARELAALGRAREAIRAWYHAVLTRCYGAGVLHYRRGCTNWEYVHALSPAVTFRARFEELTRTFDVEWYGRAESSPAVLDAFAAGTAEILRALGREP